MAQRAAERWLKDLRTRSPTPRTYGKAERLVQRAPSRNGATPRPSRPRPTAPRRCRSGSIAPTGTRPHGGIKSQTPISLLGLSEDNLFGSTGRRRRSDGFARPMRCGRCRARCDVRSSAWQASEASMIGARGASRKRFRNGLYKCLLLGFHSLAKNPRAHLALCWRQACTAIGWDAGSLVGASCAMRRAARIMTRDTTAAGLVLRDVTSG